MRIQELSQERGQKPDQILAPKEIEAIVERILDGGKIDKKEALLLARVTDKRLLYEGAYRITQQLLGRGFDTCSIINVKSGNCPEDCKWCAQSRHFFTGAECYGILPLETCTAQAVYNRRQGVKRFSLVASGRGQSMAEIEKMAKIYRSIHRACDIKCCASLGLLDEKKLQILYDAGVSTYHCNMETAPRFFKKLVSTHTQEAKIATIEAARKVGMRICSGGIIGMGETEEDRIDFALFLRSLGVESIPINILQPIPGTPLANVPPLSEEEYLTTVALFRFINPTAYLRFSGGRIQIPIPTVRKAMHIGINAAITGDMLTTVGARCKEDMALIKEVGYSNEIETSWEVPDRPKA